MHDHTACDDFARSQRRVQQMMRSASPGAGLPEIEPGMPTPAGTGMGRRSFLLRSAGLALSVYGGSKLGIDALDEGVANASSLGPEPVLVSVFLPGGIDSLSVLAPVRSQRYIDSRPTLRLAEDATRTFDGDTRLQWHPSVDALKALWDAGKVAVFPSIGYDSPDQSHFTSRHYWEVGALDVGANLGWMGRYLDRAGSPDNPLQGLSLAWRLSPALASSAVPVAAVSDPVDFGFWTYGVGSPVSDRMMSGYGRLGNLQTGDQALAFARRVQRQTDGVRRSLSAFSTVTSPVTYPTAGGDFPKRLAALAQMLDGGLPIRCVAIEGVGGYDTHSGQADQLTKNLKATLDAVAAFQADLEARGIAGRVVTKIWSEFGRRPEENGSRGTDHGAAGCAFLVGTRVRRQVIGEWTGVDTLDRHGNLRNSSDFRDLYIALLGQWLKTDPAAIIPGADQRAGIGTLIAA